MVEESLIKLGFTEREAGVYTLLLRLGVASANDLIKELGWHRQLVYDALDKLRREGLASSVQAGPRQRFRPLSPAKILNKMQSNLELAQVLIPQLENLRSDAKHEQIVQVHTGVSGVKYAHEDILDSLKAGETVSTLGASGPEYARVMGDYHTEWTQKRIQKQITLRVLGYGEQSRILDDLFIGAEKYTQIRYLPVSYESPTSTKIYANKIIIQIWDAAAPAMILIENPKVAQNYLNYFDFLWKMAKLN